MPKKELKVEGMSCGHCKAAVEAALKTLDGVNEVEVRLDSGTVVVDYQEGALAEEELMEAVKNAGYQVV